MGYPKNPETIVVKNMYYPRGLREKDIWEYYQKVKRDLLKEVSGRDIMLWIMVDVNKPIVRRVGTTTKFIRITPANYDNVITGRTISIHTAMRKSEDTAIIDIDIDNFKQAQQAVFDVYNVILNNAPFVKDIKIVFTGKASFHIRCELKRKINIDSIKMIFNKMFTNSDLVKKYTIGARKRERDIPNIDTNIIRFRAPFIALNSLSVIGLRCMEVNPRRLSVFNPRIAKI